MDVYLVPTDPDDYELYCEVPDDDPHPPDHDDESSARGILGWPKRIYRRLMHRFRMMLAEAERERRHGRAEGSPQRGWFGRMHARMMRFVAESIAEQRLLWHLRGQTAACLHYPDDIAEADAVRILREQLGRDFDKHRFWLAIDSLLGVGSLALVLFPGPNVLGYYFAFRMVGHFLSVRGARQGLNVVEWSKQPERPLSDLRTMLALDPDTREARVQQVADQLRLEHLAHFYQRAALKV
jgi:hypothetical protein